VDAYEKGILKIKFDESFTSLLDNNPVYLSDNGAVIFNISAVDQLNKQYNPTGFNKLFGKENPSSKFFDRHRAWGFHLWYTLYFDESIDIKEIVLAYEQLPEVTLAEPQYRTEQYDVDPVTLQPNSDKGNAGPPPLDWTPNDPDLGDQWHYNNTGQQGGLIGADIDLLKAWNIETGNSYVVVSIHDGGVQYNHPDLSGNMWTNWSEYYGSAGVDDDLNGYIDDIHGWDFYNDNASIEASSHGSHVGGTVAAETDNGVGVAGVAGGTGTNDGVRLMTCMVYLPAGGGGNGHHLAPVYAADNGACIEQNSWGYTSPGYYDVAVLDAIDYFNANGGGAALLGGGITIYAAGNSNSSSNYYPGYYSGTFAVAATNNLDEKAYFGASWAGSNYGTWIDASAPGGETWDVTEKGVYSTVNSSSYGYKQGTSMACPHMSGTAALIISLAYGQLTSEDVADILRNTTDDIDALNPGYEGLLGTGRLNSFEALVEVTRNYLPVPGILMPIPDETYPYGSLARGYWFTAPTDFTVTGLRVPFDNVGNQTIEIIRFNSGPPPAFSGTTNDFVSLGRWVNQSGTGVISCNIPVNNGDIIGIFGCRGTTASYAPALSSTTIAGHAVTLTRMGMQYELPTTPAQDIWQEAANPIGRIEMYYEITPGIWTGVVNHFWNNPGNWSDGTIPNAGTNVTIPAGTPNDCWVSTNDGFCNNITIEPGSYLRIFDEILNVSGSMYIHGLLRMEEYSGTPGELHVAGNIVWESGSTADIQSNSLNMWITGAWNFENGANVQLTQGYVTFEGGANSWIRSYDTDCYFNHIRNFKTGIYGLAVSELSEQDLYINGNIYNNFGNLFRFRSTHTVYLNGFLNNASGHLEGQDGTFVFNGSTSGGLKPNTGDYLNNVTINTSSILSLDNTYSNLLTINGDVLIESGGIGANNFTIEVAGTWTNTVGTGGFVEGTSTVRFNKATAGVQFIYGDEHFNILECATDPSTGIRPTGDVSCNVYDWTSGGISTSGSSFTANDLADNSLYGYFYALTGGDIILYEPTSYVDLFGDILIFNNGLIQVNGGADESYWSGSGVTNNVTIESGGTLDFVDMGIYIWDYGTLNYDIQSGSTIKVGRHFYCDRTDVNPAGGILEFQGGTDANINIAAGSTLYDLLINKSGGDKSNVQIKNRNGGSSTSSKSNTATLDNDIVVTNDVMINDGTFLSWTFDIYVGGDWSNTIGSSAFNEGLNTVIFDGPNEGDILTEETFYNMTVDKSIGTFTALEMYQNVTVSHDIHIIDGVLEMNPPSNLIIGNDVTLEFGAGLNANDPPGMLIYVGGNWTNYNTTYSIYEGYWHGYVSKVIFNSGGNSILTTSAPQEDFYHLTIYKSFDEFRPNDNIQVFGDLLLFDGEWNDNVPGLTHTFHGDFEVTSNAAWFTHINQNTVVFAGENDQEFIYNHINVGYFHDVIIDKSPVDYAIDNGPDQPAVNVTEKNGPKAQTITMYTDMDLQLGGTLTIDEGTLEVNDNILRADGDVTINSGGTLSMSSNSTLWIDEGAELSVYGGTLTTYGSPGNEAKITHRNSGYYAFEVENNGTVSAEHTIFEYMNYNGVWVKSSATVDPAHAFNNCTFRYGDNSFISAFIFFNNNQVLTVNNANFPLDPGGTNSHNAGKANSLGEVTFINAIGDFAGEDYDWDNNDKIHWTYDSRTLDLTVFVEGPFNPASNKMNLDLNPILPIFQPFDDPPLSNPTPDWYYEGTENVGSIPNIFIVDWVLVQLRDAPSVAAALPGTEIFTQAAFLTNTGNIVDLDGLNPLTFSGTITNNLYAVVWTRNHLGIISANPLVDVGGLYTYDFSASSGQAFGGTNSQNLLSSSPVIWGVIPGDANGTGLVALGDKTNVWSQQVGEKGYLESDYNFDGEADNVDKNDYWLPNMGSGTFVPE